MQKWKKTGAALGLAGVILLAVSGCAQKQSVYTAGLQTEDVLAGAQRAESEVMSETEVRETKAQSVFVYVCGAVENPGVYELTEGARVYEAISLAGGFTEEADTQWLNQAELVSDGQKLCVLTCEETAEMDLPPAADEAEKQKDSSGKVDLNTASAEELMTLPGIGEAKAESIIQYRTEQGAFTEIEQIQNIPGIKSAVFSKIKDKITVSG